MGGLNFLAQTSFYELSFLGKALFLLYLRGDFDPFSEKSFPFIIEQPPDFMFLHLLG